MQGFQPLPKKKRIHWAVVLPHQSFFTRAPHSSPPSPPGGWRRFGGGRRRARRREARRPCRDNRRRRCRHRGRRWTGWCRTRLREDGRRRTTIDFFSPQQRWTRWMGCRLPSASHKKYRHAATFKWLEPGDDFRHHVGVVRPLQVGDAVSYCQFETTDEATWFTPCWRLSHASRRSVVASLQR